MFGDVAVPLLKAMGMSGDLPGAILASDIPKALQRLQKGAPASASDPHAAKVEAEDDPQISLHKRAVPLIDLLERSARQGSDVSWAVE